MRYAFSFMPVALLGCLALYTPNHEASPPAEPVSLLVMGNATIPTAATVPNIDFDRSPRGEEEKPKTERKKRDCPCPCDCGCCESGICTCCMKNYAEGIREAKRTGKPLVVWVDVVAPSMEKELSDFIHCHSKRLEGKPVPYVAVLKFSGNEYSAGTGWSLIPNCEMIRRAANPPTQQAPGCPTCPNGQCPTCPAGQQMPAANPPWWGDPPVPGPQAYVPPMMFQPAPMMPMMGGFGGGGGGSGGSC